MNEIGPSTQRLPASPLVQRASQLKSAHKKFAFKPLIFGLLSGGIAVLLCLLAARASWFVEVDDKAEDMWTRLRGPITANPKIVLIAADEASQSAFNQQWPWPRSYHAQLVGRLTEAGAKVIAFDLLFSEDGKDPEQDKQLAEAFLQSGRVIIASLFDNQDAIDHAGKIEAEGVRLVQPRPQFLAGAETGFINVDQSPDGVARSFLPLYQQGDVTIASLDVATVMKYQNASSYKLRDDGSLVIGSLQIPPFQGRGLAIRYVGPPNSFRTFSYYDVIDPQKYALLNQAVNFQEIVRDAIVLVGCTLRDQKDFFRQPFGKTEMTGLEVHANIIQTILDGAYIQPPPFYLQALLILILGFSAVMAMLWLRGWLALSVVLIVLAAFTLLCYYAYIGMDIAIPWSYPSLAIVSGYLVTGSALRLRIKLAEMLGPYKLLDRIGQGGMATVYRARHKRTNEVVALKVMLPHLASDKENVLRFDREISVAAQLNHPNVVRILDLGDVGGQPYCAMELIEGQDLHRYLNQCAPLTPQHALPIAIQVADALHTAHELGIVHRDVKPSNVMLTRDGISKIMDFGLAFASNQTQLTLTGAVMGTPDYMSPEQCRGERAERHTDIYSFGAVLYLMLTGKMVFMGENSYALVQQHLNAAPTPMRTHKPDLLPELDTIVLKCLAKNPVDRYASMAEVRDALDSVLRTLPPVPKDSPTQRVDMSALAAQPTRPDATAKL